MKLKIIGKAGCSFLLFIHCLHAQLFKPEKAIIDVHTSIRCYGFKSDCYAKNDYWYEYFSPVKKTELKLKGDSYLLKFLETEIEKSRWVEKAIVLAFDQTYDENGNINKDNTQYYVPNRFLEMHTKGSKKLLFGASVHPYRPDSIDEIDKYAHLASIFFLDPKRQSFDLKSPQMILLANKLSVAGVPLMIEMDLMENYEIEQILETGVVVIISGQWMKGKGTKIDKYDYFTSLLHKYKNLFASIDSLPIFATWIDYFNMVVYSNEWEDRLIYGSGFPYDSTSLYSSWLYPKLWGTPFVEALKEVSSNRYDHTVLFKRASDTRYETLYRANDILPLKN